MSQITVAMLSVSPPRTGGSAVRPAPRSDTDHAGEGTPALAPEPDGRPLPGRGARRVRGRLLRDSPQVPSRRTAFFGRPVRPAARPRRCTSRSPRGPRPLHRPLQEHSRPAGSWTTASGGTIREEMAVHLRTEPSPGADHLLFHAINECTFEIAPNSGVNRISVPSMISCGGSPSTATVWGREIRGAAGRSTTAPPCGPETSAGVGGGACVDHGRANRPSAPRPGPRGRSRGYPSVFVCRPRCSEWGRGGGRRVVSVVG